jgi:mRNA-degrading endonuclease RelE of RelBE toxin-antitoxin system
MSLMTNEPHFRIDATDEFTANLKHLNKKYRHVRYDVGAFVERLRVGDLAGDRIQGVEFAVYKARIRSSDLRKGKSSGYRVIYYIRTSDKIVLVTIYAKSEQADTPLIRIMRIIEDYEESQK